MAEDTGNTTPEGDQSNGVTVDQGSPAGTANVDREQIQQEQQQQQESENLLAGKFKTPEDLEQAYKELEKKLGAGTGDDTNESTEDNTGGDEGSSNDDDNSSESEVVYSEQIDKALSDADVNPKDVASEFEENGELSDNSYQALEKAGYPREMVDAYISGLQKQSQEEAGNVEAEIEQIKSDLGGEDHLNKVKQYVATQYSAEQIEEYNAALETGDPAKVRKAVQDANAAYLRDIGQEGSLIGGGKQASTQGYESEAQMMEDMKDPRYKSSQAFRDEVQKKMAASPNLFAQR